MSRLALLLSLLLTGAVARADSSILLESYSGEPPEEASRYVDYLMRTLGKAAPAHGPTLRRTVEAQLSLSAGPSTVPPGLRSAVEEGRRHFIEGEFTEAIAQLEEARTLLLQRVALLASDQSLRDLLHRSLLFLSHAYLRTHQGERATERVGEVIRSFPDRDLSLVQVQFGPELVKLYREVRRELDRQQRGTLAITTQPPGCLVFVNERFVGLSPTRVVDLYPGRYRVYAQRQQARGRVHLATVAGAEHSVEINFELDSVLETEPRVGLRYASQATMERQEIADSALVGQALEATSVLLVGLRRHQGRRALLGTTISPATRRVIRSGMVVLEPTPPAPATLKALGRFLVAGEGGAGVIIKASPATELAPVEAERGRGPFSPRVWKWVTLGLAVGGLASGITLLALDGRGTCEAQAEGGRCPEMYRTLVPGAILTSVGGLAAGGSGLLFYLDARRVDRTPAAALWPVPGGLGLTARLRY